MVVKVAINGYGTIGKRVADAIDAQDDMEIIGVTKTRPSFGCDLAVRKGYPRIARTMQKTKSLHLVLQGTTAKGFDRSALCRRYRCRLFARKSRCSKQGTLPKGWC